MKILLLTLTIVLNCFGHGDHSIPGAIPPSPNGGRLGEAKHHHQSSHKHNHKEAKKKEIFFEATLKNDLLTILLLELEPVKSKVFIVHDITQMEDFSLVIKDARKDKKINSKFQKGDKQITVKLENIRVRRMMVSIKGKYKGATYIAKIQVEKK